VILERNYKDESKVKQLIELGNISSLGREIGEEHDDVDNRSSIDWTTFYMRDKNHAGAFKHVNANVDMWLKKEGEEYNYLFIPGAGWFVNSCHLTNQTLQLAPLQETLKSELAGVVGWDDDDDDDEDETEPGVRSYTFMLEIEPFDDVGLDTEEQIKECLEEMLRNSELENGAAFRLTSVKSE
jgi:hypothetical protein